MKAVLPQYSSARRVLALGVVVAGLQACTALPPLATTVDAELLTYSDQRRTLRQERAAVPLEQRIDAIEADLEASLVEVGDGVLVPRAILHNGRKGPLHLESNAAVLSALAAKYGATGDPNAKALGARVIKGIMALDALSGELDGFVPFYADARSLRPTDHATHSNAYTQLLFAYVMADACFGPSEDIQQHVSLIYQRFVRDNFALRQPNGQSTGRANLQTRMMAVNARKAHDRRLLDAAASRLGDEHTRELTREHRWRGRRLGPMHVRLFAHEFPTTSSSWLNLLALTALNMLGESDHADAVSLARRYARDDNPLFRTLAGLNGGSEDLAAIRSRLEQFPYPATSSGIINTHRDDVNAAAHRYIKFSAAPATRQPLPLYEIRSTTYLWKRNLLEVDSMPEDNPTTLLGHDLYQAYWLYRLLEASPSSTEAALTETSTGR